MDLNVPDRFLEDSHHHSSVNHQTSTLEKNKTEYRSVKVYGRKAAACFNLTSKNGTKKTINIEAAPLIGPKEFNWNQKISLLVSDAELPNLICVLAGYYHFFEGKYHGQNKNKSFTVRGNKDGVLLTLAEAGTVYSVQIFGSDLFYVITNILTHIKDDYGDIGALDLLCLCKATTGRILNCSQNQNS